MSWWDKPKQVRHEMPLTIAIDGTTTMHLGTGSYQIMPHGWGEDLILNVPEGLKVDIKVRRV